MSDSSAVNTLSRVLAALLRASSFVELFFESGRGLYGNACATGWGRGVGVLFALGRGVVSWNEFVDLFCAWLLVRTLLINVREKAL